MTHPTAYALIKHATDGGATIIRRDTFGGPAPTLPPEKGLEWVLWRDTPPPAYDTATQGLRELDPVVSDGSARRVWEVYPLPVEDLAATSAPEVPAVITPRQARLALLAAGLLPQVDAALAALPEPQRSAAQIEWEYATEVRRDHSLVAALSAALGMDAAAIDALFTHAATL